MAPRARTGVVKRPVPGSVAAQTFPLWDSLYGAQSGYLDGRLLVLRRKRGAAA